ncbi:MAG TPA: dihydrofolate reductase family protein, partial [Beutenbergiaceae bacterium]|nr:dihydrofolate reductase family protein [Beutenbergiaceae bacterium]
MGKLIYSMVTSLDGYVADERGDFGSWARPDEEVLAAVNDQTAQVGTFLYGRRMYQLMSVWETDPQVVAQSPGSADFARLWQRADKVVFSTTIQHVPTARTVLYRQFDP